MEVESRVGPANAAGTWPITVAAALAALAATRASLILGFTVLGIQETAYQQALRLVTELLSKAFSEYTAIIAHV